jgi:LysR family transcriptional regulator, transcriptional activator of the cysJI operon
MDNASHKAFISAAKTLNFTVAAEKAAMTQSGISQHIAKLEESLGAQLFKRVNKKVYLTRAGEILLNFLERQQEENSNLLEQIHGEVNQIRGLVRYAMPHSCLFTPHFPILLKKRKDFLSVTLDVNLCPNETVFQMLLDQQIDFGFVTKRNTNPIIDHAPFAAEEYILIGADKAQLRSINIKNLTESNFVSYPGMNILFDFWLQNHFNTKKISYDSLKITGNINSLDGAITMVEHGVGLTVLPKHCAANALRNYKVFEFDPGKKSPLSEIFIVTLNGVNQPKRVKTVLDAFWEMK